MCAEAARAYFRHLLDGRAGQRRLHGTCGMDLRRWFRPGRRRPALGLKFGITSGNPKPRLATHRRDGYRTAVRLFTKLPPMKAAELEQRLKLMDLPAAGFSPVRGREYFGIDALPVVLGIVDRELALYPPKSIESLDQAA